MAPKCAVNKELYEFETRYSLTWWKHHSLIQRKGNCHSCDNHRGISLLSTAGKILGRVILNRLTEELAHKILPESQCGFRSGRGTANMVFTARQIQEKCREQGQNLYIVFIDFTKAFDSVNRDRLWKVMKKFSCPDKLINIIKSLHTIGCKLRFSTRAPFLTCLASQTESNKGVYWLQLCFAYFSLQWYRTHSKTSSPPHPVPWHLQSRTDSGVFNLHRFRARTKVMKFILRVLRELLFADDCAIMAHWLQDIQRLTDCLSLAAKRFGLTINLKKTEVMVQSHSPSASQQPAVLIDNTCLNVVDKFCYLGSVLSRNVDISDDLTRRIGSMSAAFGRLESGLLRERGIKLSTKVAAYRALVLSTLLHGCESWTTYWRHIRSLDQFQLRCLRRITKIKWQDKVLNQCFNADHVAATEHFSVWNFDFGCGGGGVIIIDYCMSTPVQNQDRPYSPFEDTQVVTSLLRDSSVWQDGRLHLHSLTWQSFQSLLMIMC